MADQHPNEGSSMGNVSGESSDSLVELKVKTLDSQICSLLVDKNVSVCFKRFLLFSASLIFKKIVLSSFS